MTELADFQLNIKYRPGKANGDVDALSRMPRDIDSYMDQCTGVTSQETIRSYANIMEPWLKGDVTWISAVSMNIELVDQDIQNAEAFSLTGMQRISCEQLQYDQRADPGVGRDKK